MILTQYQITHMENRMLVDSEWPECEPEDEFTDEEAFEDDDIDEF